MPAFQAGGGSAQQDRTVLELSAFNGDIPRGVAESVLLHKGGVMLLIDNNDSGLLKRREDRGARAQNDSGRATPRGSPDAVPFSVTHSRVECEHGRIKSCFKTRQGLGRQCNLGQ